MEAYNIKRNRNQITKSNLKSSPSKNEEPGHEEGALSQNHLEEGIKTS